MRDIINNYIWAKEAPLRKWAEDYIYVSNQTFEHEEMTVETEDRCMSRRDSMQMEKKYCVIGMISANSKNINRTWFATEAEAVTHAGQLLRNRTGTTELRIVKVVKVVQPKSDYEVLDVC